MAWCGERAGDSFATPELTVFPTITFGGFPKLAMETFGSALQKVSICFAMDTSLHMARAKNCPMRTSIGFWELVMAIYGSKRARVWRILKMENSSRGSCQATNLDSTQSNIGTKIAVEDYGYPPAAGLISTRLERQRLTHPRTVYRKTKSPLLPILMMALSGLALSTQACTASIKGGLSHISTTALLPKLFKRSMKIATTICGLLPMPASSG